MVYQSGSLKYLCDIARKFESDKPQLVFMGGKSSAIQTEEVVCDSLDIFVEKTSYWSTWCGTFAILDSECLGIEKDTDGCEMLLWHDRKIHDLVAQKGRAIICNKPITTVLEVNNKDVSYGIYKVFYVYHLSILKKLMDNKLLSEKNLILLEKIFYIISF